MTDKKLWKYAVGLAGITLASTTINVAVDPSPVTVAIALGMLLAFVMIIESAFQEVTPDE